MADRSTTVRYNRIDVTETFASPTCRTLLAYWRDKAAGRPYPAWTDLNLMDLYKIAGTIVVRDVVDGGRDFRCRFSGTGMSAMLGVDGTGETLAETYGADVGEALVARYRPALTRWPVRALGYVTAVEKNLPRGFEAIYLPLADATGAIGHIIAAYDFNVTPDPGLVPPPT